jgi:hypothetical protein
LVVGDEEGEGILWLRLIFWSLLEEAPVPIGTRDLRPPPFLYEMCEMIACVNVCLVCMWQRGIERAKEWARERKWEEGERGKAESSSSSRLERVDQRRHEIQQAKGSLTPYLPQWTVFKELIKNCTSSCLIQAGCERYEFYIPKNRIFKTNSITFKTNYYFFSEGIKKYIELNQCVAPTMITYTLPIFFPATFTVLWFHLMAQHLMA